MGEILKNWLLSQIGMKVNFDPLYLGKTFQDGVLFKQILNNYGIISQSHLMPISHCSDFKMCQQNLRQLCVFLNLLNINFNETTISEIARGQCSTIIRLLYEMFFCFENKQYLYFVTKQNQINASKSIFSRFELGDVPETTSIKDGPTSLERPLVENKDITKWYKEKYSLLKEKLKSPTKKPLSGKELNEITKENSTLQKTDSHLLPVFDFDDYSKPLLINDEMNVKQGISNVVMPKDDYLLMLKLNKRKNAVKKCLAKKMQNVLLNNVWKNVHDSYEKEFNELFSKLLIKQSLYEKQIVMKLFQEHESNTFQKIPETLIEQEKEHLCNLQLLDEFERGKKMYDDEKQRILELHRRLYEEKQKARAKEHFNLCTEVIDSLINISSNVFEYKILNNASVPLSQWNEWKQLFYKNVEIPLLHRHSILTDDLCDDESIGVISLVQDCDEILNEYNLHEYLYFVGTWFVEEIFPDLGSPNEDEQIVLGYVVHRLLELKYPFPPSPKPAEIPPVVVAALVLDLQDSSAIQKLKMLFTKSQITVLEVDDLIKFSIDTFKAETNQAEPEKRKKGDKSNKAQSNKSKGSINKSSVSKEKSKNKGSKKTEKSIVNEKKNSKSKSKKEKNVKSSKSEISQSVKEVSSEVLENLEIILENEKRTQTPAVLPEEDELPKRSEFGLVGEQIFNILTTGLSVSDTLLVSTLIEYLKYQHSMNGWVLINFPNSIVQAALVELALTGREIPNVNLTEHGYGRNEVDETLNDLRHSKLVPYPSDLHVPEIFKTFFTKIICTKVKTTEKADILLEDISNKSSSTKDEEEPVLDPETFYKSQDVFYEFCCDELDLNNLKQLARYIMAESDIDRKPSNELFGEDILNTLSGKKKKGRKSVKNKKKTEKSLKKERNSSKEKRKTLDESKPEIIEVTKLDEQMSGTYESVKPPEEVSEKVTLEPLKPGSAGWNYVQNDIPNPMGEALANLWENMEKSYLTNLKQFFFNKRILLSRLIPYKNFVSKTIRALIEEPDIKQDLIAEFQEFHNSIDENLLPFTEMKNELHCKVFELQEKLWSICDKRKVDCADKLKDIINQGWTTVEMCFLANIYLSFVQIELDRFVNTLILLHDYYTVMLGKLPSNHKINLSVSTIDLNSLKETLPEFTDTKGNKINEMCENNNIFDCIFNLLTNNTSSQDLVNPFCIMLETNIYKAIESLENVGNSFENEIKKEENLLIPSKLKTKKEIKTKTKPNKKQKESIQSILSTVLTDETEILKRNLFDEWRFVIENEIKRAKFRCSLIKCKGVKDLSEFLNVISLTFHELFNDIKKRYFLGIESVDNVCKMISTAIEEETKILQKIVICDDELFVTRQTPLVEQHWPKELLEQTHNNIFSTEQARMLMEDLKRAAPCGIISKTPLVYILEDILLKEKDGNVNRFPEIWNMLKTKELEELIDIMFGNVLFVDWRDLIICCLNIPFPTDEELLMIQKQCQNKDPHGNEILSYENFTDIVFWFERELADSPKDRLKFVNAKNLLYNLFKDDNNYVNYTALLLSFCKDIEPELGFSKALALAIQKRIILCESDLYLEQLSVGICSSEHGEQYEVVNNVMSGIVNMVLIQTEGAIITEVEGEETGKALENSNDKFSAIIGDEEFQNLESFSNKSKIFESTSDPKQFSSSSIQKVEVLQSETKSSMLSNISSQTSHSSEKKFLTMTERASYDSTRSELCFVAQRASRLSTRSEQCCVSVDSATEVYWPWTSKVPIETILTVIVSTMMPRSNTLNIQQTLDELIELEVDGSVTVHLLLKLPCMTNLFLNSKKFYLHSVHEVILNIIKTRCLDKNN